jgi:deoxyribodipyrimidine photo-lyase
MNSIYWLRHDLRLHDNPALTHLTDSSSHCAFVFSTFQTLKSASKVRKNFYAEALNDLQTRLKLVGHELLITEQPFHQFLQQIIRQQKINAIYFTQAHAFDERQEEKTLENLCQNHSIDLRGFDQGTLFAETSLPFPLQQMPFIFTDFRKKLEASLPEISLISAPQKWPKPLPISIPTMTLSLHTPHSHFKGGETHGLEHLEKYIWQNQSIKTYKETRNNLIAFEDSTKLSPWLNAGCLSARYVMNEVKRYESEICQNESTYWVFFELLWRDYFKFFSRKFAQKIFLPQGLTPGHSPNANDVEAFQIWCQGLTPEPFINANMLELNKTGWMSNRGRQNVASYLIHDLGVNWTWGARYFEEKLIDYDPDLNWGNWLYLSGRGPDPRSRKFNTAKQAATYDPDGEYQRSMLK